MLPTTNIVFRLTKALTSSISPRGSILTRHRASLLLLCLYCRQYESLLAFQVAGGAGLVTTEMGDDDLEDPDSNPYNTCTSLHATIYVVHAMIARKLLQP